MLHMELVVQAANLAWKIVDAYQNAPKQRGRCKTLVEQISSLGRLLSEIKPALPNPLTPQAKTYFELLNDALEKAYRIMEKASKASIIKYIFMSRQVNEELMTVSNDIEACLRGLPLIQISQTTQIHDQVRELQSSFGELGKQLQEQSSLTKEQQDLAAEVVTILRSRDSEMENSTRLFSWLAEKFESDVQTVRNEWQDMKDDDATVQSPDSKKKMIEADLLQQIVLCIDEIEATRQADDAIDHTGIPWEFKCGICHGLMKRPVILSSGHTFCKECIEENFRNRSTGPPTCPCCRAEVKPDLLIKNFALDGAISRWRQTNSAVAEAPKPPPLVSKRSYSDDDIQKKILELGSQSPVKLLKTLNYLLEASTSSDGSTKIYKQGGIEPMANLLDSTNRMVTEKVTAILARLTCSKDTASTSNEDTDTMQLLNDIFESCLDKLTRLMTKGTGRTRLKAAETLANLLSIAEVTECLLSEAGIISALAGLPEETGVESGEALEVCLNGLRMLSKNNDLNLTGTDALVACLIDLLHSQEAYIIEEAVLALRSAVSSGGVQACAVLRTKKALPHLLRCVIGDGSAQEAGLIILEQFVKHKGCSELVEAGFTKHIAALVSNTRLSENPLVFTVILRLSNGCLESQQDVTELQNTIPRLMAVLRTREYSADVLALLRTLCIKDSTCKELVLETGGLQAFQELAGSSLSTCRRGALALIRDLLVSTSCQEAFFRGGGIGTLSNITVMDESVDCITEAVVSLSLLTANPKMRHAALETLDLDKIISFLDRKYPVECREAAASIALLLLAENTSVTITRQSLKLLMSVLQYTGKEAVKRKVGKLLLTYATTRGLDLDGKMINLGVFIELADGAGEAYKDLLLKFVSSFSRSQAIVECGGIPILLNAFANKGYRPEAAASIRKLVNTIPSAHEALLDAGFGRLAVEFLMSDMTDASSCMIGNVSASLVSIFGCRKQDAFLVDVIKAFAKLMNHSSPEVIASAACSIFQFFPLDNDCLLLLRTSDLVKPLLLLVQSGPKLEALELLAVTVEDSKARGELCREDGIPKLIDCLGLENHRAQELASSILLTLGKPNDSIPDYRLDEIRRSMISNGIIARLLTILQEPKHLAVMNGACLIRNLGYSGQSPTTEENVFIVLVELLKFYLNNNTTEGFAERLKYVFLALQPFFSDRRLKMLLGRNNVVVVLRTLQTDFGDNDEEIKSCALSLLVELLEESSLSKEVSNTLVINSVSALKDIMRKNNLNCQRLACLVLKYVIKSGSSSQQVCKVIRERDCIKVLFSLKQIPGCTKEASEVLELMKRNERAAKIFISEAENSFYPWVRTTSAPTFANYVLTPNYVLRSQWCDTNGVELPKKVGTSRGGNSYELESCGDRATVEALLQKLSTTQVDVQRAAVADLRLLAKRSIENRVCIADAGGVPLLIDLLSSSDARVQEHAVTALLNLSIHDGNKSQIVQAGAINPIVEVLKSGSMEARENAAATLFSLSVVDDNKVTIGQTGAIPALVELLKQGTARGKKDAATALFNLSIYQGNKAKAVRAGVVPPLMELLDPNAGMVDEALAILAILATHQEGRTAIGKESTIPLLVELIRAGSARNKENAAAVLLALGQNDATHLITAKNMDGILPLMELVHNGTSRARRKASMILELINKQEQTPTTS